ncbi:MAG: hypothetical protein ACQETI_12500, partial [Halobacteriota archaeon]
NIALAVTAPDDPAFPTQVQTRTLAVDGPANVTVPLLTRDLPHSKTVSVVLEGAPDGLARYNLTVSSDGENLTDVEAGLVGGESFTVVDGGPGGTSVTVEAADDADAVGSFTDNQTLLTLTFEEKVTPGEVSLHVNELVDDGGVAMDDSRVTPRVGTASLFTAVLPGVSGSAPTDPNGDGLYEDIDGDGDADFDDAIDLAFAETGGLTAAQRAALDFDGDGDVDFDDAIELAFSV